MNSVLKCHILNMSIQQQEALEQFLNAFSVNPALSSQESYFLSLFRLMDAENREHIIGYMHGVLCANGSISLDDVLDYIKTKKD